MRILTAGQSDEYNNPSLYEQSVYELMPVEDA
jgi:hypothetical protein